jgi:hypothetical protein
LVLLKLFAPESHPRTVKSYCETVVARDRQLGAFQEILEELIPDIPIRCPVTEAPPLRGIPSFAMAEEEVGGGATEMLQTSTVATTTTTAATTTSTAAVTAAMVERKEEAWPGLQILTTLLRRQEEE